MADVVERAHRLASTMRYPLQQKASALAGELRTLSSLDLLVVEQLIADLLRNDKVELMQLARLKDNLAVVLAEERNLSSLNLAKGDEE